METDQTAPILTLDEDAFRAALAESLDDFGLDSVDEYDLDAFSDKAAKGVVELAYRAFDEWGCLRQPAGSDWEVVVYALDDGGDCENNILVAVRPRNGAALVQLCSLTVDANRLADDQFGRSGADLLIEILGSVLDEANRLLVQASDLPTAATS